MNKVVGTIDAEAKNKANLTEVTKYTIVEAIKNARMKVATNSLMITKAEVSTFFMIKVFFDC